MTAEDRRIDPVDRGLRVHVLSGDRRLVFGVISTPCPYQEGLYFWRSSNEVVHGVCTPFLTGPAPVKLLVLHGGDIPPEYL